MTRDDLKKLFPNSKFPTVKELKAKEDSFSIGDRVKVADNIRCRQKGKIGTIVRIDPEDKYGWKSFVVKFDDEKYGSVGFQSDCLDKIQEKKSACLPIFHGNQYNSLKGHPMTPYASAFIKRACERKFDSQELMSAMRKMVLRKQAQNLLSPSPAFPVGQTRQGLMNRLRAGIGTGMKALGTAATGLATNNLPRAATGTITTAPKFDWRKHVGSGKPPLGTYTPTDPAGGATGTVTTQPGTPSGPAKSWIQRLRELGTVNGGIGGYHAPGTWNPTTGQQISDLTGQPVGNGTNSLQKATSQLGQTDTTQGGGLQPPTTEQQKWIDLLNQFRQNGTRQVPKDNTVTPGNSWQRLFNEWKARRNGGKYVPTSGRTMEWRHEWDRPGDTMLLRGPVPRFM